MKTSKQWLAELLSDSARLVSWLERQYVGETLAADRLRNLAHAADNEKARKLLSKIADDEQEHADWVQELLLARSQDLPKVSYEQDRYWAQVELNKLSNDQLYAAGYHAETMRLERIRAIVDSSEVPDDIRQVFAKILPMEEFHAKAFESLASAEAIAQTAGNHAKGMQALGLEI